MLKLMLFAANSMIYFSNSDIHRVITSNNNNNKTVIKNDSDKMANPNGGPRAELP